MGQAHAPSAHTGSPFSSLLSKMCLFAKQSATYKRPLIRRVPYSPRYRSLAAFGRRPWCPLTGRVGRHPKPITKAAANFCERHGGTCFNTGRQGTQPPRRFLIDEMTTSTNGKRCARSTPESRRHGRRPWHLQRAIGLNRYRDSAHFEVGSQL